jgi:prepilin-type N-terminal cleavage/methylation domain-containing protein
MVERFMEVMYMAAKSDKGFTLVELLVVIAIIALLLSILMPALSRARDQAKAVVCQTNLHQWGQIFYLYTNDNKGRFWAQLNPPDTQLWMKVLRPYYPPNKGYCCPVATKPTGGIGGRTAAWGVLTGDLVIWAGKPGEKIFGSYGVNYWITDNPAVSANWNTVNNSGTNNIPLLLDSMWVDGAPTHGNKPPPYEGYMEPGTTDNMQRYCINRHNGTVNSVFMDYSVRKVGLKGLWKLKWNRGFNTSRPEPDWARLAPWMNNLK